MSVYRPSDKKAVDLLLLTADSGGFLIAFIDEAIKNIACIDVFFVLLLMCILNFNSTDFCAILVVDVETIPI